MTAHRAVRDHEHGFTLVELMVALSLTSVIVGVLVTSLLGVERSWTGSRTRVVSTQNTRAALDAMVRDVRMAGSGFGGHAITTAGVPGNTIYPCRPAPGAGDADSLFITGSLTGVGSVTTASMGSPSDDILVADTEGFAIGDRIVITNGVEANLFEVTGIETATGALAHSTDSAANDPLGHVVWPSGGYPPGSTVVQVQSVAYWVDEDAVTPRLMRRRDGEAPLPVAFDVRELRVQYRLADGTLTRNPADPSLIRTVQLDYVPGVSDGTGAARELSVRVQPRVLG